MEKYKQPICEQKPLHAVEKSKASLLLICLRRYLRARETAHREQGFHACRALLCRLSFIPSVQGRFNTPTL